MIGPDEKAIEGQHKLINIPFAPHKPDRITRHKSTGYRVVQCEHGSDNRPSSDQTHDPCTCTGLFLAIVVSVSAGTSVIVGVHVHAE